MEEWKEYKLGDVSSVSSSKRIFADEYQSEGIPFYRSKEIIEKQKGISIANELYIKESRYNEIKNKFGVPQKGDILLTSVGTLGIPYLVKDEIFYFKDGNITWFYNFKGINNRYLYYWFLSPIAKHYFDIKAIGSTQKALTIETLKKFDIVLPSKSIQQKVADVLKSFDDKIELNNRINANLEEQAQALFRRWFVDFEFPNEEGLPYKSNGGTFVDSELGRIPKGWTVSPLLNFCTEIVRGNIPTYVEKSNHPILNQKVNKGTILDKQYYKYNDDSIIVSCNKLAHKGDILLNSLGQGTLGRIHLYKDDVDNVIVDQFITILRTDSFIKSAYLAYMLNRLEYQNMIESNVTGSTGMWVLTINNIRKIKIIEPNKLILNRLRDIISYMYKSISINIRENENLSSLRDSLLPKLMNNEIEIH